MQLLIDNLTCQEMLQQEKEEAERQRISDQELELKKLLYEKWKREKYCRELIQQAAEYRRAREQERMEERQLDDMHLQRIMVAEMLRERRYFNMFSSLSSVSIHIFITAKRRNEKENAGASRKSYDIASNCKTNGRLYRSLLRPKRTD